MKGRRLNKLFQFARSFYCGSRRGVFNSPLVKPWFRMLLHSSYSPHHALAGGVLIGMASLLAMLATGRIPGISGMCSRVLRPQKDNFLWRIVFLVGLVGGAGLAFATVESASVYRTVCPPGGLVLAGLLVGFGTRLGGGCTSGHGVCGIGMRSKTAFIATLVFIMAGIATVFLLRQAGLFFTS